MILKVKKLNEKAVIPSYSKPGDAGLDLTAIDIEVEQSADSVPVLVYKTGLSIEIPEGYVGLLFPRSSIANTSLVLTNSVGVIDSGYRGEIIAKFKTNTNASAAIYGKEERVVQLIILPYPTVEIEECSELSETERGECGFGSTNNEENMESLGVIGSEDLEQTIKEDPSEGLEVEETI